MVQLNKLSQRQQITNQEIYIDTISLILNDRRIIYNEGEQPKFTINSQLSDQFGFIHIYFYLFKKYYLFNCIIYI